jgi:two-component system, OmpR family, alkaline phosphatase synthesis response regulator PhoP
VSANPQQPRGPHDHDDSRTGSTPRRILVVEDSPDLAQGLCDNLQMEGYEARTVADGEEALEAVDTFRPHLVVLDLMLPRMGGFEFLQAFRGRGCTEPVLILSARSEQMDKLRGFRAGADDYVTKPFDLFELLARIEVILRRSYEEPATRGPIRFGDVTLDARARTVHRDGREVELSPKELDLALALVQRAGAAVSREELLREVWDHKAVVRTRTVDTHMLQLRKKLEPDPGSPRYFHTVPKVGYRFEY